MQQSIEALKAVPTRMNEGWNTGDATAFYGDFTDDAELVDFEGTVLTGRDAMIEFQQPLFGTVLKGSRLVQGHVPFARIVQPGMGVVHQRVSLVFPGEDERAPHRHLMQLVAAVWQDDRWRVASLQNARVVSLEASAVLDSLAASG